MTDSLQLETEQNGTGNHQTSLSTGAARQLATTTKSVPQMQEITSRWLLRMLPWVQVKGGTYRVNRRLTYTVGDGRVAFTQNGAAVGVIPEELRELPLLRDVEDAELLRAIAGRFEQADVEAGGLIVEAGQPADDVVLIAHGRADKIRPGRWGDDNVIESLADGDHFGDRAVVETEDSWGFTVKAKTPCTIMRMPQSALDQLVAQSDVLRREVEKFRRRLAQPQNREGEAEIRTAAGHVGEPSLPSTFPDYDTRPREYELSVAQAVLRVHSRVADLYNDPMDQTEQQLRLTLEALRERQEYELVNNREFGLLHNADFSQRILPRTGPPTPDDLDELLSRRRKAEYFFAHPRTIAAIGRELNKRGLYPDAVEVNGHKLPAWRNVPILPCNKIPITDDMRSSVIVMRTGEDDQGVVGLHQVGIPEEYEPSVSVRFMGIDEKAVISYLVSIYYSVAVLVPDALGVLEHVEIGR